MERVKIVLVVSAPDVWRKLLGQEVVVALTYPPDGEEAVVARGTLLAFDDGGEAVLQDEMGFVHYVWPTLDVRN